MKQLKIYGASDDLIEVDGFDGDEIGCFGDEVRKGHIRISSVSENAAMDIHCFYGLSGATWAFAPSMIEEDCPLPFPVRIEQGTKDNCDYSTVCTVDCPDDAVWKFFRERA